MDYFTNTFTPFPPLAEQKRIVERVDALMALCDQLEATQEQTEETRAQAHKASLDVLGNASSDDEFDTAWKRVLAHWDTLLKRPEDVTSLRQTILQLAVQGRLVPQDPADEPASVLLEKIAQEKTRLIKEKKIKKQKALPPVSEDEKPFDLPEGWKYSRLENICAFISDGDHQAPPKTETGIPFLVIGDISSGKPNFRSTRQVPAHYYNQLHWTKKPNQDDIIYTVTGSFGIPMHVSWTELFCVQRHIAIIKTPRAIGPHWILLTLSSRWLFSQAQKRATGIAQKTVSLTALRNFVTTLPPLAEQKRIVERVDALMTICDQLEAALKQSQDTASTFAKAMVEHIQ